MPEVDYQASTRVFLREVCGCFAASDFIVYQGNRLPGEHTDNILRELLPCPETEIGALRQRGALA